MQSRIMPDARFPMFLSNQLKERQSLDDDVRRGAKDVAATEEGIEKRV